MNNIQLDNINLRRNKQSVLQNIQVSLNSDDFILMTGQNGSGKSTFLKIIAGLLKPDSFTITHTGEQFSWSVAKKFLRRYFCYLHQTPYLFNGSVYDNIAYGLKYRSLTKVEIKQKVEEALELIKLQHLAQRSSSALSGGEKQRVAIARSWVIRPAFILLDEPFANMDKHSRYNTYAIINQLKKENIGIILTSHDPHHGELNFNKQLHLYQGQISEKFYN